MTAPHHKKASLLLEILTLVFVCVAISACSSATSTIGSISAAISPEPEEESETEAVEIPPEKPPVLEDEDCRFDYAYTADYNPESEISCEIIVVSEVDDVSVSFEESRRKYKQAWSSRPTTHTLVQESCNKERVRLSKRYYPTQFCSLDFSRGNRATLRLTESDWLKYGWIRVDYYSGDLDSVDVDGLSEPYTMLKGSHIAERIPLGDHNVKINGLHKEEEEVLVQIWKEDHMRAVVIDSADPGEGLRTLEGSFRTLKNGYGELKVVSELDGIRFDIKSKQHPDIQACLLDYKTGVYKDCVPMTKLMAPNTYSIPAGDYSLVYRGTTLPFVVEASETHIIMLGERATLL